MLNRKDGCVLIKCNSTKSTDKMKDVLITKLGQNYDIKESQMRRPSIFVSNIEKDFQSGDIVEAIRNQNLFLDEADEIKLVSLKMNKHKTSQSGIIECNGSAYKKLLSVGKIYLGLHRCSVRENLRVVRCFKCYSFNHKINDCKYNGPPVCSKCSGSHDYKTCKSEENYCNNCIRSNTKYKTDFSVGHTALDTGCPLYEIQMKRVKDRTDYDVLSIFD